MEKRIVWAQDAITMANTQHVVDYMIQRNLSLNQCAVNAKVVLAKVKRINYYEQKLYTPTYLENK
jgi:hypothetical protein